MVSLGHLLVNDPAARRHPLDVACRDRSLVTHAVAVLHRSREHIRNRLDPAVRMPWKPRQIIFRHVVAEIIQQQERVELRSVAETKSAPQMPPRAFRRRLGFDQSLYRSYGHSCLLHRECTDWMQLDQHLVTRKRA